MTEAEVHRSIRGTPQADWPALVAAFADTDFDSPRRSTVPLVAYWRDPTTRFGWLQERLGFPAATSASFSFEHPVGPSLGRGKPSYTDLMILAPASAIAIESKYTEPSYENVRAWLHEPRDQNRCDVLRGWLSMLDMATGAGLTIDAVLHLPYQLVHRAASACFPNAKHRAVIYQVFDATHRDRYLDELRHLRALVLKHEALKLAVLVTPAVPVQHYTGLLARWDAGERKMASEVRSALLAGQAFAFKEALPFLV
jgi:hypothetical protein